MSSIVVIKISLTHTGLQQILLKFPSLVLHKSSLNQSILYSKFDARKEFLRTQSDRPTLAGNKLKESNADVVENGLTTIWASVDNRGADMPSLLAKLTDFMNAGEGCDNFFFPVFFAEMVELRELFDLKRDVEGTRTKEGLMKIKT